MTVLATFRYQWYSEADTGSFLMMNFSLLGGQALCAEAQCLFTVVTTRHLRQVIAVILTSGGAELRELTREGPTKDGDLWGNHCLSIHFLGFLFCKVSLHTRKFSKECTHERKRERGIYRSASSNLPKIRPSKAGTMSDQGEASRSLVFFGIVEF